MHIQLVYIHRPYGAAAPAVAGRWYQRRLVALSRYRDSLILACSSGSPALRVLSNKNMSPALESTHLVNSPCYCGLGRLKKTRSTLSVILHLSLPLSSPIPFPTVVSAVSLTRLFPRCPGDHKIAIKSNQSRFIHIPRVTLHDHHHPCQKIVDC